MNETKKFITILVVAIVAIIGVIGLNAISQKENEKIIAKYDKLLNSKEAKIVYIARPTCAYCQQFAPVLEEITTTYNVKYHYMNTDELNDSTLTKLLNKFNTDESTPQLIIVKGGKVVDQQQGYTDREGLFTFLQENGFIGKDEVLASTDDHITKIDKEGWDAAIKNDENTLVVIAQTGCSHCEEAQPVLNELAKENEGLTVNWLDILTLSDEDKTEVLATFDEFNDFGTPLLLVVKNGKVVDSIEGYESKDEYVKFLQKNNMID